MKKLILITSVLLIALNGFSQQLIYKGVITDPAEEKSVQLSENIKVGKDKIIKMLKETLDKVNSNDKAKQDEIIKAFTKSLNKADSIKTDSAKVDKEPETTKTELIAMFKKALDEKNTGKTEIGRIILKKYAFVFPNKKNLANQIQCSNGLLAVRNKVNAELKLGKAVTGVKMGFSDEEIITYIVEIDSVKFDIKEGVIEFLKIFMHDGSTYYNKYAPIQLIGIEQRFCDKLFNTEDNSFVFLKDVLSFATDSRFNYFPDNEMFTVKNDTLTKGYRTLDANNGINSLINIQIYSDMLALFGDQANGLVQVEANSKIYLHRKNLWNRFIYFGYAIEPFFQFNKLDSKFDTINTTNPQVNRVDLFRRSSFSTGLSLSLFRWDWRPSNSLQIKAGYLFSSSNVVINQVETKGFFHTPYAELSLTSKRMANFGIDISGRYLLQKLNDNTNFTNAGWHSLTSMGASIYYFPSKKTEKDKIFLRFVNFLNYNDRTLDYNLLQFGVSKNLNFK